MSQPTGIGHETESRRCRPAPCPPGSLEWEAWDLQLAANDVARLVVEALPSLDLRPLWQSYSGCGSLPYSPELLLAMVLVEKQRGRASPSQWHRDQGDSVALLWVGHGIRPARSVWYEFRDRLGPFLDGWNEQVLRRAIDCGVTTGAEAASDGTLIAACASRHRLVNQSQITSRLEQLDAACAQDLRQVPLEKNAVASRHAGRAGSAARALSAGERVVAAAAGGQRPQVSLRTLAGEARGDQRQ